MRSLFGVPKILSWLLVPLHTSSFFEQSTLTGGLGSTARAMLGSIPTRAKDTRTTTLFITSLSHLVMPTEIHDLLPSGYRSIGTFFIRGIFQMPHEIIYGRYPESGLTSRG